MNSILACLQTLAIDPAARKQLRSWFPSGRDKGAVPPPPATGKRGNGAVNGASKGVANGVAKGTMNGVANGVAKGVVNGTMNGVANGTVNGVMNEASNGASNGAKGLDGVKAEKNGEKVEEVVSAVRESVLRGKWRVCWKQSARKNA